MTSLHKLANPWLLLALAAIALAWNWTASNPRSLA